MKAVCSIIALAFTLNLASAAEQTCLAPVKAFKTLPVIAEAKASPQKLASAVRALYPDPNIRFIAYADMMQEDTRQFASVGAAVKDSRNCFERAATRVETAFTQGVISEQEKTAQLSRIAKGAAETGAILNTAGERYGALVALYDAVMAAEFKRTGVPVSGGKGQFVNLDALADFAINRTSPAAGSGSVGMAPASPTEATLAGMQKGLTTAGFSGRGMLDLKQSFDKAARQQSAFQKKVGSFQR